MNGETRSRDGCRPNHGGWHGGDELWSLRVPLFVRKRMGGEGALAWTSAAAGTVDGGLQQAGLRGHEGGSAQPLSHARRRRRRRRRCSSVFAREVG